jgi:hypothetical protein
VIESRRTLVLRAAVFALQVLLVSPAIYAQRNLASESQANKPASSVASAEPSGATTAHMADDPDLLRETQLGIREKEYVGLVWWTPFEFWQVSGTQQGIPPETTAKNMRALHDYTIATIFLARIGGLGALDFVSREDIRKNVWLRDASGAEYLPIPQPGQDAKNLAAIVKPALAAALGKAGENFGRLFFPARGKDGAVIADASRQGPFFVVLKNIAGSPENVYEWNKPLPSIAPPKCCPVGKERVHADWHYCPRHGVPLNSPQT